MASGGFLLLWRHVVREVNLCGAVGGGMGSKRLTHNLRARLCARRFMRELNEAATRRRVLRTVWWLLIPTSYDLDVPQRVTVGDASDARQSRRAFGAHNGSNKRKISA
jgi:hypothetical protein